MGTTIKDIALRANVSHTTVSRALNDSPLISQETKERIRKIAEEMDYVPNLSAKSLVTVKSYNIGLFFSSLVSATSADFIYTMIKVVGKEISAPYNIIVNGLDKMYEHYAISLANFDGIILVSQLEEDEAFIQKVKKANVPLVVINRKIEDQGIVNLYCNEMQGIMNAVEFLVSCGHKKIAFMEGDPKSASNLRRKKGYYQGMEQNNFPVRPEWILHGDFSVESGYEQSRVLMQQKELPTSVICASDAMAIGAMRGFVEQGVKIPDDISIIGFDNGILSSFSVPALTSIGRPLEKMGMTAARMLLQLIDGWKPEKYRVVYDTTLYSKESVRVINE